MVLAVCKWMVALLVGFAPLQTQSISCQRMAQQGPILTSAVDQHQSPLALEEEQVEEWIEAEQAEAEASLCLLWGQLSSLFSPAISWAHSLLATDLLLATRHWLFNNLSDYTRPAYLYFHQYRL